MFQPNKTRLFCDNGTVRYIITPRTETATKTRGGVIAALLLQACSLQLLWINKCRRKRTSQNACSKRNRLFSERTKIFCIKQLRCWNLDSERTETFNEFATKYCLPSKATDLLSVALDKGGEEESVGRVETGKRWCWIWSCKAEGKEENHRGASWIFIQ